MIYSIHLQAIFWSLTIVANEIKWLLSILKANNAKYHMCQSSLSSEKQLAKASQKESRNEVPQKRSRCSSEELGPSHVNKIRCCWCIQYKNETKLWAAGQRWAKTKPNSEHVRTIIHNWKKWLQWSKTNISCVRWANGDLSSNELFYHTPCLTKYTNQYDSF